MTAKSIFISYRHSDVPDSARSIYEMLTKHFKREILFKDTESLSPGAKIQSNIEQELANSAVLIAVIGQGWLAAEDEDGNLRVRQRSDYVRFEIEEALNNDLLVIPVIIPPARLPRPDELISTLRGLTDALSITLRSPTEDYERDCQKLVQTVTAHLDEVDPREPEDREPEDRDTADDTTIPRKYLDYLKRESGHIEILGLDAKEALPNGLPKIYVPAITRATGDPTTHIHETSVNGRDGLIMDTRGDSVDLVLHRLGDDSLYLTGDPGSGKTTFCQWVTYVTTHGALPHTAISPPEDLTETLPDGLKDRLPLWIRLRYFWRSLPLSKCDGNWNANQLEDAISAWLDGSESPSLPSACFRDQLASGSLLLLIDGVDEVPEEDVQDGRTVYPRANLISGLADALVSWRETGNRVLVTSRPYGLKASDRAKLGLPQAHLAALTSKLQSLFVERWYHATDPQRWREFAEKLFEEIGDRTELNRLKQNPLLLTALCVKFREGKRLPQDVYHLYDSVINCVLYNRFRGSDDERRRVRWRLGAVALGMHYGVANDDPRPAPLASVHLDELDRILGHYIKSNPATEGGSANIQARSSELLTRSGLLLPREENAAEFFHQDFRDFLAAEHWSRADLAFKDALQDHADNRDWRRMLGFLFAKRIVDRGGVDQPLRDLAVIAEKLTDSNGKFDAAAALVVADCLEIAAGTSAESGLGDEWPSRFFNVCEASLTRAPKAADRNALFLALGRLGWDFRPGVGLNSEGLPDIEWLPVPDAANPEFFIAKYPITNAQYQVFIDSGSEDKRWWQGIEAHHGIEAHSLWIEPSAPRIVVSWYEAIAYTRWLSAQTSPPMRSGIIGLPTEEEWVAAYVGEQNEDSPWQGSPDAQRHANFSDTNLDRTSIVGAFPDGVSHCGALDMAGNTYEWCLNKYETSQSLGVDDSNDHRVLRGGSWGYSSGDLRSSARYWLRPVARSLDVGFRVVCRPPLTTDR